MMRNPRIPQADWIGPSVCGRTGFASDGGNGRLKTQQGSSGMSALWCKNGGTMNRDRVCKSLFLESEWNFRRKDLPGQNLWGTIGYVPESASWESHSCRSIYINQPAAPPGAADLNRPAPGEQLPDMLAYICHVYHMLILELPFCANFSATDLTWTELCCSLAVFPLRLTFSSSSPRPGPPAAGSG